MRRLFPPRPDSGNSGARDPGAGESGSSDTGSGAPSRPSWSAFRLRWPGGLSTRLLLLTAAFALIAEVMILAPSLAEFQERWLLERERAAEVASLALDAAPNAMVSEDLMRNLLGATGVTTVAVKAGGVRRLLRGGPAPRVTPDFVDLRADRSAAWLFAPWATLLAEPDRTLRVVARPRFRAGDFVEIVVPSAPLKLDLEAYLIRTLIVSLVISVTAGAVVYLALLGFIVRPMRRLALSIEHFRADPESGETPPPVAERRDEIGRVEAELSRMQEEVRQALRSRARLAALGEAVAKINHDLRNMLTSAQIASERLAASGDPKVAAALPRLERALDRALGLAQNVLTYGRSEEPAPAVRRLRLAPAVEAAGEDAGLTPEGVRLVNDVPPGFQIEADPDHLHRILVNLMRNARQAVETIAERKGEGVVRVTSGREGAETVVRMVDNGPGLPERARARLFQPFTSSARAGGAGLGLAISRVLAQGHGGALTLVESGEAGATFELRLPDHTAG